MSHDGYLDLLDELGITIEPTTWFQEHPERCQEQSVTVVPSVLPTTPIANYHSLPVFSSSQIAWADPGLFGFHNYLVYEDPETAHPLVLDYKDECYYSGNYVKKHLYSRPYRIRWVFNHLIGFQGACPLKVLSDLMKALCDGPSPSPLFGRNIYCWVFERLRAWKLPELYLSIPFIIRQLGGSVWIITDRHIRQVLDNAYAIDKQFTHHQTFQKQQHQRKKRIRFPKLQFVLLYLLRKQGVLPPYYIPWARTATKARQLLQYLDSFYYAHRQPECGPPAMPPA